MLKCLCPPRAAVVAVAGIACAVASVSAQTVERKKDAKFAPERMPVRFVEEALYDDAQMERFLAQQMKGVTRQAPNDDCSSAEALSLNTPTPGSTTDAAVDPTAGTFCGTSITAPGVWYSITGTGNTMTASLCGGTFYDSKISVFCGSCTSPTCVDGNDDSCGLQSEVSWCSEAGVEYFVLVHGFSSNTGDFVIQVTDDGVSCPDPVDCAPVGGDNDLCDNAIPLTIPGTASGSTDSATPDDDVAGSCGTSITAPGVWYSIVGNGNAVIASLCNGTDYDSKLSVFTGTCDAPVCVTGNDDACGLQSEVSFCAEDGVEYFILVHGFSSATGNFTLDILDTGAPCECPDLCMAGDTLEGEVDCFDEYDDQYNGGCNSAPPVFSPISCGETVCGTAGTFLFTDPVIGTVQARDTDWYRITLATAQELTLTVTADFPVLYGIVDTGGIDDCSLVTDFLVADISDPCVEGSVSGIVAPGTWYLFVAPADFEGVACGSEYRAGLTCADVPTGACCLPDGSCTDGVPEVACDDLDGLYQGDGSACAAVSCPQPQGNDLCQDAVGPLSVPSSTIGTTVGATTDLCPDPDPFCYDCGAAIITSPGVWYTVIGTGNTMTASLCSPVTGYDSKLSVFCGTCEEPVCIDGNDDACGLQSEVTWCSQPGVEYLVLVHGFGGATGSFELLLSDDGAACSGGVQCLPEGACCLADGSCMVMTQNACESQGGEYAGDDVPCPGEGYVLAACNTAYEDISATGSIGPSGDDGGLVASIGFTFNFFGDDHTDIGMSTNGYLTFGGDRTDFSNDDIPDDNDPNDLIAVLWDDLIVDSSATIYYETRGTAPNQRFIVQWTNIRQLGNFSDRYDFQAVLYEADNSIEMIYERIVPPSFSGDYTIGIENQTGTDGIAADADNVATGDCYRFELVEIPDPCNQPPECTTDQVVTIWPPNHMAVEIDVPAVAGATDPDGDPVFYTILSITQDEPLNDLGDGNTSCDGGWTGTTAYVRAERQGGGNGRVYRINYEACDDAGACCSGWVEVHVPHSQGQGMAVDDGQNYDSTPCFGRTDTNADGVTNQDDLDIVIDNYGQIGPDEYLNWPDGDVNADARTDVVDLYLVMLAINENGGYNQHPETEELDGEVSPNGQLSGRGGQSSFTGSLR